MTRVALMGGSFNPPHVGHWMVATWLLVAEFADEVWLVPAFEHPFAKDLAPFEDRIAMCDALASWFPGGIRVSPVEKDLGGPSYTTRLVEALIGDYPDHRFELVVGSDLVSELPTWKDASRLRTLVPIRVVARSGFPSTDSDGMPEFPKVSSSDIRARISAGKDVRGLVPRGVHTHIQATGLYNRA